MVVPSGGMEARSSVAVGKGMGGGGVVPGCVSE